jgi:hypothetical protein
MARVLLGTDEHGRILGAGMFHVRGGNGLVLTEAAA